MAISGSSRRICTAGPKRVCAAPIETRAFVERLRRTGGDLVTSVALT
jgi:hypothetical protein